jgi:hypothetical protein
MASKLQYKAKYQTTIQIEDKAKKILEMLDPNMLKKQNLDTLYNQYLNTETPLKEVLENLKFVCNKIINNLEVVDKMGNWRSNFNSHFDQIISSLPNLSANNFLNIVSYTDNLMQWLGQWGLLVVLPTQKEINQINSKINNIDDFDKKIFQIEAIKNSLEPYKNATEKLDEAKNVVDFFNDKNNIETVNIISNELVLNNNKAKSLLIEAENVLSTSSNILIKEFSDLANRHSKNANLWLIGVFVSVFIFLINLIFAHFVFNGFSGMNFSDINFNKLDIRVWILFLIFPIWFFIKNHLAKGENNKIAIFQNVKQFSLYILLPSIFFATLFTLIPEKISINILSFEGLKIDTSSYYGLTIYTLTRITIILPSSLILYLTSKYFGQNNMLKEEYEYKSAAMRTFSSAIQSAKKVNENFDSEDILNSILEKIYTYPRKNISKYPHDKSSILDPLNIKNLKENISDIYWLKDIFKK